MSGRTPNDCACRGRGHVGPKREEAVGLTQQATSQILQRTRNLESVVKVMTAMWLACHTQQEIAETVGVDQDTVSSFVQTLRKTEAVPKSVKSAISHESASCCWRPTSASCARPRHPATEGRAAVAKNQCHANALILTLTPWLPTANWPSTRPRARSTPNTPQGQTPYGPIRPSGKMKARRVGRTETETSGQGPA